MVARLRAWLFGPGLEPSLVQRYREVWASEAIRTGPADPRRREAEANLDQVAERIVRIQVPWRQA